MRPFRYIFDPLFVMSAGIYALNRFVLKPHFATPFLHQHLNDLLCIPFWVPIMLFFQRIMKLRDNDDLPALREVLVPLLIWTWLFEVFLPGTDGARDWCIADPADVVSYAIGAIIAVAFWRLWYSPSPGMGASAA